MTCTNKLYQSIVNSCNPKKGIQSTAYWAYLSDLVFEFTNNTIASIVAPPLGVIEAHKFGLNAGHDLVVIEDQPDRFIQKFTAVLNENSAVVDKMDNLVFFVKENGATTWSVYGAKFGLWKSSQAQMINDNRATIAVEFSSREGMEEEYDKFTTSIDIAALPNMSTFDLIYGGTIANGGAVKLTIDSDKTGYIKLPNGTLLTTVAGVINTTYTGVGGTITYYVPKTTVIVVVSSSGLTGDIKSSKHSELSASQCNIKTATLNNCTTISIWNNANLTNIIAGSAKILDAVGCALTAKSIGDILYQAYVAARMNVVFEFSGGTNANLTQIEAYMLSAGYGVTAEDCILALVANGGVLTINGYTP